MNSINYHCCPKQICTIHKLDYSACLNLGLHKFGKKKIVFEGGKETWRDEEYKTVAYENVSWLFNEIVYLKFRFPRLPSSGRIFLEFVTAPVTEPSVDGRSAVTERSRSVA